VEIESAQITGLLSYAQPYTSIIRYAASLGEVRVRADAAGYFLLMAPATAKVAKVPRLSTDICRIFPKINLEHMMQRIFEHAIGHFCKKNFKFYEENCWGSGNMIQRARA
jgi:hypothetical protein